MSTITEQNEHGEDVQITTLPSGAVVRELLRPAPAPVADKWVTLEEARSLFTDGEKINIYTAAKTEVAVQVWLDDLHAVQHQMVNKRDPRFVAGVAAMEYGGLIAAGRAAVILA